MSKDHVLKTKTVIVDGKAHKLIAFGGLHYIRGNSAPYFSLTGELWRPNARDCEECGCIHERLLKAWPELADLAALHLSDINGIPSHGVANGWYWMAGALGGAGEQYHGANRETYGRVADPVADSLRIFSEHVRIPLEEAAALRDLLKPHCLEADAERLARRAKYEAEYGKFTKEPSQWSDIGQNLAARGEGDRTAKALFEVWCAKQVERWKAEADACIAKHGLVVYGDKWEAAA